MKGFRVWGLATRVLALLVVFFVFLYPISAAESTGSATSIKSKCEKNPTCNQILQEIASKAAQLKQEVDRKLTNKAYVGKIKSKSDTTITLAAISGPKIVSINQDTDFESQIKGKAKSTIKNLAAEDYIAALGDADETGVLTAKSLILMPPPADLKTFLWGQIISTSDKLVTLKDRGLKNISVLLPNPQAVKLNDFVIVTGNKDKNEVFNAQFVYVIPQPGVLRPRKTATPSASPTKVPAAKKTS